MKNKLWIVFAIFIGLFFIIVLYFLLKNINYDKSNYSVQRTGTNKLNSYNNTYSNSSSDSGNNENYNMLPEITDDKYEIKKEELISSFSTKIYSKDSARQNNISITSSVLNKTIVNKGQTFSFCSTIGQATSDKGYQEADIFDNDGNKKKGLGGRKLSSKHHPI